MFNFEKLSVWQKAIDFADLVYSATKSFPPDERFGLTNQMRRAAVSGLAVLTLVGIAPRLPGAARILLSLSSASLLGGMACALAYAVGEFTGIGLISLGQMARIHGPLNGLGFVLGGLLGWTLVPRNLRPETL